MDHREAFCVDDRRNPMFSDLHYNEDDPPNGRRDGCQCDNCFYGRHDLACQVEDLEVALSGLLGEVLAIVDDGTLDADTVNAHPAVIAARAAIARARGE